MIAAILSIAAFAGEPRDLVASAVRSYRRSSSVSSVEFVVHREAWERRYEVRMWSSGEEKVLVKIDQPSKDRGVATLKFGDDLWIRSAKGGRVVRIPSAMMEQPWMGSDFSNRDLSSLDDLVDKYSHRPGAAVEEGAVAVECVPAANSDVPWGKVILDIKEDCILRQRFYDQRGGLVKQLVATDLRLFGAKRFPMTWRMVSASDTTRWTLLRYKEIRFDDPIPRAIFEVGALETER